MIARLNRSTVSACIGTVLVENLTSILTSVLTSILTSISEVLTLVYTLPAKYEPGFRYKS